MVELPFPVLHEFLIMIGGESGYELVACWPDTGVAVGHVGKTFVPICGKLNFQATGRDSRHDL